MDQRSDRDPMAEKPLFRSMVRNLFSSSRKNLKNNLLSFLSGRYSSLGKDLASLAETAITEAGLSSHQRAEELDLEAFIRLESKVESLVCQ